MRFPKQLLSKCTIEDLQLLGSPPFHLSEGNHNPHLCKISKATEQKNTLNTNTFNWIKLSLPWHFALNEAFQISRIYILFSVSFLKHKFLLAAVTQMVWQWRHFNICDRGRIYKVYVFCTISKIPNTLVTHTHYCCNWGYLKKPILQLFFTFELGSDVG